MPLVIKLQGGAGPYRLIANGEALPKSTRRRVLNWVPDSPGASTLTVMDAEAGRPASACSLTGIDPPKAVFRLEQLFRPRECSLLRRQVREGALLPH
jgi:hypothetical protein